MTLTNQASQGQLSSSHSSPHGLSDIEVTAQRSKGLGNRMPVQVSRSYVQIVRENVFNSLNSMLFLLGIALILLGRVSDALVAVGVVLINVLVSVVQEVHAKQTLERIVLLTRPSATVMREGQERHVDPDEIVVGDLLLVRPGDQVVVDGPVVGQSTMQADESLLTGESDLVAKRTGDIVYSGSFCVNGSAYHQTEKVGAHSVASQLATGARAFRRVYTPLQKQIHLVIRCLLLIALFLEVLLLISVVIFRLVEDVPLVEVVKMSVVIIGIVPIGLFLATTVSYSLGAVRIVRKGALVQQANAIESLSNVDFLCLDKTGTLTSNAITVHTLHPFSAQASDVQRLLGEYVASVSVGNKTSEAIGDVYAGQARHVREEVTFSSVHKWSGLCLDEGADQGCYILGAPEILEPSLRSGSSELQALVGTEAAQGLGLVLFASTPTLVALHDEQGEPCLPPQVLPLGLVSLHVVIRPEAAGTLAHFAEAGVQVKMISGDSPQTVEALARQAGWSQDMAVVTGMDLAQMDAPQFAQVANDATIFGRITPQQKEHLVRTFRQQGHYVAMIGDGVNDVLSLKEANLGIAMHSGSQATRSVADIVLLNDSFGVLPDALREGQRIRNGMHSVFNLFLTRVIYVTLLLIASRIVGVDGFPFAPKQSSLLALLTVGIPSIALTIWARPGNASKPSLVRSFVHFMLPAALLLTLAALVVFLAEVVLTYMGLTGTLADSNTPAQVQAGIQALAAAQSVLTTFSVVCGLLLLLFVEPPTTFFAGGSERSGDWRPSCMALALLIVYIVILVVPPLRSFFELTLLGALDYLAIGVLAILWGLLLLLA
jgi:cation-transporting P-type ATPase E